jgi:hypothetical protein
MGGCSCSVFVTAAATAASAATAIAIVIAITTCNATGPSHSGVRACVATRASSSEAGEHRPAAGERDRTGFAADLGEERRAGEGGSYELGAGTRLGRAGGAWLVVVFVVALAPRWLVLLVQLGLRAAAGSGACVLGIGAGIVVESRVRLVGVRSRLHRSVLLRMLVQDHQHAERDDAAGEAEFPNAEAQFRG